VAQLIKNGKRRKRDWPPHSSISVRSTAASRLPVESKILSSSCETAATGHHYDPHRSDLLRGVNDPTMPTSHEAISRPREILLKQRGPKVPESNTGTRHASPDEPDLAALCLHHAGRYAVQACAPMTRRAAA
jgi:hypothetical protein